MFTKDFKIDMEKIDRIKNDIYKLKDVDFLKAEFNRLTGELKKVDLSAKLSPKNKARVKKLESKYNEILKTMNKLQSQMDREITQIIGLFHKSRSVAKKRMSVVKKKAQAQKKKISKKIAASVGKTKKRSRRPVVKRKTTKKATTKKSQ